MSGCARCRCTPTWPRTRCPTTIPSACSSRVRVEYPVKADKAIGLGTTPTMRLQRAFGTPGPLQGAGRRLLVWSHWVWFAFPHGTVALRAAAPPRPVPGRRGAHLRDVRPRRDRLLGDPDRPAVVRRPARPDGGRPDARAAPDDGRVRRAVLEAGLGASVRCPRGEPPGRHALAALRHVRDGRARPGRHGPRRRACSAGPTPPRSASRSSTSASTTSSTSLAGLALAEGIQRAQRRRSRRGARALSKALQVLEAKARA